MRDYDINIDSDDVSADDEDAVNNDDDNDGDDDVLVIKPAAGKENCDCKYFLAACRDTKCRKEKLQRCLLPTSTTL